MGDVLAVVHDQQAPIFTEQSTDRPVEVGCRLADPQRHPDHRLDAGIADGCQFGPPQSRRECIGETMADLQRQARLAGTTATGHRHEPVRSHETAKSIGLRATPDEARQRHRQRARRVTGGRGRQWLELVAKSGDGELPDLFGPFQVAETVLTEGAEVEA